MHDRRRRATGGQSNRDMTLEKGRGKRYKSQRNSCRNPDVPRALPKRLSSCAALLGASDRHVTQWTESLTKHAFPVIWSQAH